MYAIVQARLGSNRLPNKSMLDIVGKPMLGRVLDRIKMVLPDIIVATPDEEIVYYAFSQDVCAYLGSEDDVLDRYYQAAKIYRLTDIIRITSDNPLIDPAIILKVIDCYIKGNYDYASNNLKRTYPLGLDVEVFSFKALKTAWIEARDPYEREHVTPYIKNHPEIFKLGNVENDTDLSCLRWTVDYQEDLDFAREIYSELGENFTMGDVLQYIKVGV